MKILMVGAGVLGSLYAAKLQESGQDVTILARTVRANQLRENGIVLVDAKGQQSRTEVSICESLGVNDDYDLAIVLVRKNQLPAVLNVLKDNLSIPTFLFMVNNPLGSEQLEDAVGRERVLLGFAGAGGKRSETGTVTYHIVPEVIQATTVGEIDGAKTARVEEIAAIFNQAGFPTRISSNMDAWLKTHLAVVSPVANAIYLADGDPVRLAKTRDGLVLMIRAIREGLHVLDHLPVPITPWRYNLVRWIPEAVLIPMLRYGFQLPQAELVLAQHARAARDEMRQLALEFQKLILATRMPTPNIDNLLRFTDERMDALPMGSAKMKLSRKDWLIWLAAGVSIAGILRLLKRRRN